MARNMSGLGCGWLAICTKCSKEFRSFSKWQTVCSVDCRFDTYKTVADGCWEWAGPLNTQGYGVLFLNHNYASGRRMVKSAHRYSYEKYVGPIPDSLCIMHTCDNPKCVNPEHLRVGTWGDNNRDRSTKGRSGTKVYTDADKANYSKIFRGSGNANAKLTDDLARQIKYAEGATHKALAERFNVSASTVGHIRTGRAWKHV